MPRRYHDAPLKYDLSLEFPHKCGQSRLADWQLVGLVFVRKEKGEQGAIGTVVDELFQHGGGVFSHDYCRYFA